MDKALEAICRFIEEQHKDMATSINSVNRVKNISTNMRNRMIIKLDSTHHSAF